MKKLILSLLLAVLPLSSFAASGTAIPGGAQSTPFIINKPGSYYLAANRIMTTLGQPAIQIDASDVTLDLNGYMLSFPSAEGPNTPGIKVKGANIEIRNGSISTVPGSAIHADNLLENVGLRLFDLRVADTKGIDAGAGNSWIERCQVIDTRGIAIDLGNHGTVKDCAIRNVESGLGSWTGIGINISGYGSVTGCSVDGTAHAGIACGPHTVVKNNRVSQANTSRSASSAGILVSFSRYSNVSENTVTNCYAAGFRVTNDSYGVVLEKNVVSETQQGGPQVGFAIVSSAASTIVRGNMGYSNAGGFISGPFIDGGSNLVF